MRTAALMIFLLSANMPIAAWDGGAVPAADSHDADKLCRELIANAKEIDALLQRVKDKQSADKAAAELKQLLQAMRVLLAGLEKLPFDEATTNIITEQMATLTHITQAYMPRIQELIELNAYGSQALLDNLHKHNADNDYYEAETEDVAAPYTQIYSGMETALSSALYALRKATDAATAKDASQIVSEALSEHRRLQQELSTLQSLEAQPQAHIPQQEAIAELKEKLEQEILRLQEQSFYGEPDLPILLPEYLKLIH
ncbi:MAG: hypothetical protein E7030_03655 [Akkermansiaceae bacterium]|nr:hypothetical protein [Akkermansiaceae bacterium]